MHKQKSVQTVRVQFMNYSKLNTPAWAVCSTFKGVFLTLASAEAILGSYISSNASLTIHREPGGGKLRGWAGLWPGEMGEQMKSKRLLKRPSSHTQVGNSHLLPFSTVGLLQKTGGPWNLNLSRQVPLHFDQYVLTNANFDKNKSDELILAIEPILLWRVCFDKGWADLV